MKRTDIKAGVVYAVNSAYGSPTPIVFLQDGASGLFQRERGGGYRESGATKASTRYGYSGRGTGYAAIRPSRSGSFVELPFQARVEALYQLDAAAELERFRAGLEPLTAGAQFEVVTSLNKVRGEYKETKAAYEKAENDAQAARAARDMALQKSRDRTRSAAKALTEAAGLWASEGHEGLARMSIQPGQRPGVVSMSVGDAEVLADLLSHIAGRYVA